MRGKFISFEGGEGAGKSTQIKALQDYIEKKGKSVVLTREPGGTPNAEQLRDLVVSGEPGRWSPLEEMLIMYTARSELVRTLIRPCLKQGKWVVTDRFADSTMVYQGYAGGVPKTRIRKLHKLILGSFQPDLTLILDVPAQSGMARVSARADEISRFEKHPPNYYEKIRKGYLKIARKNPKRCVVIDGTQSIAKVSQDIQSAVEAHFGTELSS
jgi:dTMP kinase